MANLTNGGGGTTDPASALTAIEGELLQLANSIKSNVVIQAAENLPGVRTVVDYITNALDAIEHNIAAIAGSITGQIGSTIEQALPDAISLIGGYIRKLSDAVVGTVQNLATAEEAATSVANVIKGYAPHLEKWAYDLVVSAFGNMSLGVIHAIEVESPEAFDPLLDQILKVPHLPPEYRNLVEHVRGRHGPIFLPILVAIGLALVLPALAAMAEPVQEAVRQGAWSNLPTKELDVASITELRFLGLIQEKEWRDRLSHHGYQTDVQDYLAAVREKLLGPENAVRAFYRQEIGDLDLERELQGHGFDRDRRNTFTNLLRPLLPEARIMEAFLRGHIDAAQHDSELAKYGYVPETSAQLRALYEVLPQPFIVLDMATRGAFDPKIVERFGLMEEYPEAFSALVRAQGFSQETAYGLWVAHWQPVGEGQSVQLYRRTTDKPMDESAQPITLSDGSQVYPIIGRDTLLETMRARAVPPFYREKLAEAAYEPYLRREIRGLHKMGVLTDAEVERAFLDTGASPHSARVLAGWVIAVNQTEAKDKGSAITDELRKRILQLYVADKLDFNDAAFAFSDLNFTQDEAEAFLAEAKLIQAVDDAQAVESGIGRLYVAGYIKRDETLSRLTDLGVPDAGIARLLSKWDVEIEYNADRRLTPATRDLTKAEILDAFKAGMILEEDTRQFLGHNGYPPEEVEVLINVAKYQMTRDARKAVQDALKSLYVNGVRERLDISNQLDATGMLVQQRDALLAEWDLLREQRTEKLPLATIRDMVRAGILDVDGATAQLRRHRLSEDDIALIIQLWQVPPQQGGKSRAAVS